MTEPLAPQITIDPTAAAKLSPEQRATLTHTYVANGHKQAAVEKALGQSAISPSGNPQLDELRRAFAGSDDQFIERLTQLGININAPKPVPTLDLPELQPPAQLDAYKFDWTSVELDTGVLMARDAQTKTAFQKGGVPVFAAASLHEALLEGEAAVAKINDPAGRELYSREQGVVLARVYGDADAAMKMAAKVLSRMPAEFVTELHRTGALDSARSVVLPW
jgi:hypothetical protein